MLERENRVLKHRLSLLADYEKVVEDFMALKAYVAMIQQFV